MKEFIRKLVFVFFSIAFTITFCFGLLCLFVSCGTECFAAEIPGIEEPCGLSTEELEAVLKYDLKPYAQEFLYAEEDYGINACFLASIAALESGWGRYQFKENNIFGK